MSPQSLVLLDFTTRKPISAVLQKGLSAERIAETEKTWGPIRRDAMVRLFEAGFPNDQLPLHWHWDWAQKSMKLTNPGYTAFGIECQDQLQGMMLVTSEGHSATLPPDRGRPLVYVDYLESAPWNVKPLAESPRFAGIGTVLIRIAVWYSREVGFGGRIGLHALPNAVPFYRDAVGMTQTGNDSEYHDLPYFELTAKGAEEFVQTGRKAK